MSDDGAKSLAQALGKNTSIAILQLQVRAMYAMVRHTCAALTHRTTDIGQPNRRRGSQEHRAGLSAIQDNPRAATCGS